LASSTANMNSGQRSPGSSTSTVSSPPHRHNARDAGLTGGDHGSDGGVLGAEAHAATHVDAHSQVNVLSDDVESIPSPGREPPSPPGCLSMTSMPTDAPNDEGRRIAEHTRTVRGVFGRIAPRYDLMNRLMTFGQDPGTRVTAADFTLEMMQVGQRRPNSGALTWAPANALRLPLPPTASTRWFRAICCAQWPTWTRRCASKCAC
jgi:hypothetical protein